MFDLRNFRCRWYLPVLDCAYYFEIISENHSNVNPIRNKPKLQRLYTSHQTPPCMKQSLHYKRNLFNINA